MSQLRRLTRSALAATAAGLAVVATTATGAHAATTYTPTGGAAVNFVGSGVAFTDIEVDQKLSCTKFDLAGAVTSSGTSRAYGAAAGALSRLSTAGCSNALAGPTTVTPVGTWSVAITGDASGTAWPARLTNVKANLAAANCTFSVSGVVNGTFNDATQKFVPVTGASGLTIDGGTGAPTGSMCVTLDLQPGDTIRVDGSWTNTGNAVDIANP